MSTTFPRARKLGYDVDQVEDFLEDARRAYHAGPGEVTLVTAESIRQQAFAMKKRGYSPTHVDAALERLEDAFAVKERENAFRQVGDDTWYAEARGLAQVILDRVVRPRGRRFKRVGWFTLGYSVREVDMLTDRVAAYFQAGRPISVDDIRTSVFKGQRGGYQETQVDTVLDRVVQVMLAVRYRLCATPEPQFWVLGNDRDRGYTVATVSAYRRRGTPTEPRTQVAVIERHVRAPWSLPVFASLTTLAFVLVSAMPPISSAEAEALAPSAPGSGGQTLVVAGERTGTAGRGDYTVTEPPKSTAPVSGIPDPGTAKAIAYEMVMARGWDTNEYDCLVALWTRESQWNVYAENPTSGAYGIPQALPGDKMATAGDDWQTNPKTQITWGLGYIAARYGTPCGAWEHSESVGWY